MSYHQTKPGLYGEVEDCFQEIQDYFEDWTVEMNRLKDYYFNLYQRSVILLDRLDAEGYTENALSFGKSAETYERLWRSCERVSCADQVEPYRDYYWEMSQVRSLVHNQEAFDKFMLEDKPHFETLMATHQINTKNAELEIQNFERFLRGIIV